MIYNNFSIKKQIRRIQKQESEEHYKFLAEKAEKLDRIGINFNSGKQLKNKKYI